MANDSGQSWVVTTPLVDKGHYQNPKGKTNAAILHRLPGIRRHGNSLRLLRVVGCMRPV